MGYFLHEYRSYLDDFNQKDAYDEGSLGRYEMFLNATAIGAIIAIIGLVALLTNLHEKFGGLAVSRFNILKLINNSWRNDKGNPYLISTLKLKEGARAQFKYSFQRY